MLEDSQDTDSAGVGAGKRGDPGLRHREPALSLAAGGEQTTLTRAASVTVELTRRTTYDYLGSGEKSGMDEGHRPKLVLDGRTRTVHWDRQS